MSEQLSFFAAGDLPPAVGDLEGLLVGPAQVVRRADAARVSVVVDAPWRVDALLAAYAAVGLDGEAAEGVDGQPVARTGFSRHLLPLADRWVRGAMKSAPAGLVLDGPRLRLWAVAAGKGVTGGSEAAAAVGEPGYLLRLGPADAAVWPAAGAALAAAGVAGTLLGPRADGPGYRVVGRRRLTRLRELVGPPPPDAPPGAWPAAP